jgi:hypothetical protein
MRRTVPFHFFRCRPRRVVRLEAIGRGDARLFSHLANKRGLQLAWT